MTREASIEMILGYTTEERELLQGLVCGCAEPRRTTTSRLVDQLCAEELVEGVRDWRRRLTVQVLGQR